MLHSKVYTNILLDYQQKIAKNNMWEYNMFNHGIYVFHLFRLYKKFREKKYNSTIHKQSNTIFSSICILFVYNSNNYSEHSVIFLQLLDTF